jgi:NAD-dependent deacetylase
MKKIVVLTGAGMSAESGLKTFRDADGLWEGHDVMEVATPEAFERNPALVLEFYNQRRRQLKEAMPNKGHLNLKELEKHFDLHIITQNVDNLHERAQSTNVLHLHGELTKVRSVINEVLVLDWSEDLNLGDCDPNGHQLRPHIVWFGEAVPMLEKAIEITEQADILVVIGTSMQVYPAASLINFIKPKTSIYFIDPRPSVTEDQYQNLTIIRKGAGEGTKDLMSLLID